MTQYEAIYEYARSNGSITTIEAAIHLGITKLPTRIGEMIASGKYTVKKTPDVEVVTRYGKTRITRYSNIRKRREKK